MKTKDESAKKTGQLMQYVAFVLCLVFILGVMGRLVIQFIMEVTR